MSVNIESTIEVARKEYDEHRQSRAQHLDELAEYVQTHPEDTWWSLKAVREWDAICEAIRSRYDQSPNDLAEEVLRHGTLDGVRSDVDHAYYSIGGYNWNWPGSGKDARNLEMAYENRLFYALLALQSPDVLDELMTHDIVAMHGTNAVALPSILAQDGLLSHFDQHAKGLKTGSGEFYHLDFRRRFISFSSIGRYTDIIYAESDIRAQESFDYIKRERDRPGSHGGGSLRAKELIAFNRSLHKAIREGDTFLALANQERFGVSFGLTRAAFWMAGIDEEIGREVHVEADSPEHSFAHQVSMKYLPLITAPTEHKAAVEELLAERSARPVAVIAVEAIERALRDAQYFAGKRVQPKS